MLLKMSLVAATATTTRAKMPVVKSLMACCVFATGCAQGVEPPEPQGVPESETLAWEVCPAGWRVVWPYGRWSVVWCKKQLLLSASWCAVCRSCGNRLLLPLRCIVGFSGHQTILNNPENPGCCPLGPGCSYLGASLLACIFLGECRHHNPIPLTNSVS